MVAVMDPVFEALGLAHASVPSPVAQASLACAGYLPDHFVSSAAWALHMQAVCATPTSTASTGQINAGCQEASQRAISTLSKEVASLSLCMPPPPPPPPLLESPMRSRFDSHLLQTPDVKGSTEQEQEASPLVLPDVLPAESRQSGSSCCSSADASDIPWPGMITTAGLGPEPPTWPPALWQMCDGRVGTGVAAAYPRSSGANLLCLATDVSQPWPKETWLSAGASNSPAPTTPLALQGSRQIKSCSSDAHQSTDREGMTPCALAPTFDSETPPPPSRWAFRAEAPSFVPKSSEKSKPTITDIFKLSDVVAQKRHPLDGLSFTEARTCMLRLRPRDAPRRELSTLALRVAKSAFINGRAPTPPPPNSPLSSTVPRSERRSGKGIGSYDGKRGGKAEARGHIRALAADARAHLTFPATGVDSDHRQRRRRGNGKSQHHL